MKRRRQKKIIPASPSPLEQRVRLTPPQPTVREHDLVPKSTDVDKQYPVFRAESQEPPVGLRINCSCGTLIVLSPETQQKILDSLRGPHDVHKIMCPGCHQYEFSIQKRLLRPWSPPKVVVL